MRWIALALWLAGCATAAPLPPAPPPEAAPARPAGISRSLHGGELPTMRQLMREAEAIRGLEFLEPVDVQVQDQAAIMAFVESELEEEDLARARVVYGALGLLPSDLNIRDMLTRLMGEQILGYYDPDTQRLVVREDVMHTLEDAPQPAPTGDSAAEAAPGQPGEEARIVLLHELVHALQDQHLGLGDTIEDDRPTDLENAFRAVMEGDATLAMLGYAMGQQGVPLGAITSNPQAMEALKTSVAQMPLSGTELASAPAIVRVPLLSAYVDGLAFAAHLHGRGGWPRINEVYQHKPASIEQVLHPDRYERGELPDVVPVPSATALEQLGWTLFEEDALGELELGVYLGQGAGEEVGRAAAEGWSGDRLAIFRKDAATSAIWYTAWDDEREAREAADAARQVALRGVAPEEGAPWVHRHGRAVLIVRGVPDALRPQVQKGFTRWAEHLPAGPPMRRPPESAAGQKHAAR